MRIRESEKRQRLRDVFFNFFSSERLRSSFAAVADDALFDQSRVRYRTIVLSPYENIHTFREYDS